MSTATRTRTIRLVGRCKTCKTGHAVELVETLHPYKSRDKFGWERTLNRYSYEIDGLRGASANKLTHHKIAPSCGHAVTLRRIEGVVSEHVCNAKCLASTGHVCECSCGGKNHGASHLPMIAVAA
jgi:hypothetical protein